MKSISPKLHNNVSELAFLKQQAASCEGGTESNNVCRLNVLFKCLVRTADVNKYVISIMHHISI